MRRPEEFTHHSPIMKLFQGVGTREEHVLVEPQRDLRLECQ